MIAIGFLTLTLTLAPATAIVLHSAHSAIARARGSQSGCERNFAPVDLGDFDPCSRKPDRVLGELCCNRQYWRLDDPLRRSRLFLGLALRDWLYAHAW